MAQFRFRLLSTSILIALIMIVGLTQSAFGQDAGSTPTLDSTAPIKSFEFFPADTGQGTYFTATIKAGDSAKFVALIGNTGEIDQEIRLYALNASTREGGGFAPAPYGEQPNEVTSWIDLPEETYQIKPGTGVQRTFEVHVPDGTAPGQYLAALAAEEANASTVEGSDMFTQKLRYVVPVFIIVPGEMKTGFQVSEISLSLEQGVTVVRLGLENTGDVRVRPEGTVEVHDASGNLVVSYPVKMDSIYAHDKTTLTLASDGLLPSGAYTVRVNLSDPDTGETASAENTNLEVDASATPVPQQIIITAATATPKPAADNVQFAEVAATIVNNGDPITNAQLSLVASKDGAEVERFPISQSLSLPTGETPVTTRYIPAEGWSSGTWSFELLVETVDSSGAAVVMARLPVDGAIAIP